MAQTNWSDVFTGYTKSSVPYLKSIGIEATDPYFEAEIYNQKQKAKAGGGDAAAALNAIISGKQAPAGGPTPDPNAPQAKQDNASTVIKPTDRSPSNAAAVEQATRSRGAFGDFGTGLLRSFTKSAHDLRQK